MASITLSSDRRMPPGTTVNAYLASRFPSIGVNPGSAPVVASGTVGADSTVTLTGLAYATSYAAVGNGFITRFRTDGDPVENTSLDVAVAREAPLNVKYKQFGAQGDGSTNDTAAINGAIDLATPVKGEVYLPNGVYRASVIAKGGVTLVGEGPGTVLKARAASNADVIKGANFDALTGKTKATGDWLLGCPEFTLRDLVIDGDKATQASGWGVRLWGRAIRMLGVVEIRDCKTGLLWTEFTDVDDFGDPAQVLEGHSEYLILHDTNGNGWVHRGPHDWVSQRFVCYSCLGIGNVVEQTANGYTGGVHHIHANYFLNTTGDVYASAFYAQDAGAISGDEGVGYGLTLAADSGSCKIGPGVVWAGHTTLCILRGANHNIRGEFVRSTVAAIQLDDAINCNIDVNGGEHEGTVFDFLGEDGPNQIRGLFDVPLGATLMSGATPNSAGSYMIDGYGAGTTTGIHQFGTRVLKAGGWSPALPTSNGTLRPSGVENLTYGTTVNTDHALADFHGLVVTNSTAFTMAAPTNPAASELVYVFQNTSGGAMGAITWNAVFKLNGAFTGPVDTKLKVIRFVRFANAYVETSRGGDV